MMAVLTLSVVGCKPDPEDNGNSNLIVGTWSIDREGRVFTYTFNEDGTFSSTGNGEPMSAGTYTFNEGVLIKNSADTTMVKFICDDNVMIGFGTEYPNWISAEYFDMFIREGANLNISASDIQGHYIVWMFNDEPERTVWTSLKFEGNSFEFIIPVWREHMTGTFDYAQGKIDFHVTHFMTREEDYENPMVYTLDNLYLGWHDWNDTCCYQHGPEPTWGWEISRNIVPFENGAFFNLTGGFKYAYKQ